MDTAPAKKMMGVVPLGLLALGVALGAAGAAVASRWASPGLLPSPRAGEGIEGRVLDKARESDRLLLKIEAEEGVLLATFTERLPEIDLLVDPGDTVTLDAREYRPFLEDPVLDRVRRPMPALEPAETPEETEVEDELQIDEPEEVEPAAEPPPEPETPA